VRSLKFAVLILPALVAAAHCLPCAAEARYASIIDAFDAASAVLPDEPEAAADIYKQFIEQHQESPQACAARVLRGLILWRNLNNLPAARAELAAAAGISGDEIITVESVRLARSWLARIKMLEIARACRKYYVEKVRYPQTLDKLVEAGLVSKTDLLDPWGDRFVYATRASTLFPDIPHQRYSLNCKHIKGDVTTTQKLLDGEREFLEGITLLGFTQKQVMVRFKGEERNTIIQEGNSRGGLTALLVTSTGALVSNSNYMVVLTR